MPKKSNVSRKKPTRQELRDMDHEIQFLEGIVRRDANYVEALQILGDDYTRRGRYQDGLKVDERLRQLRPDDSMVHYNLACSYSLLDKIDEAAAALEQAIDLGYEDYGWIFKDPDLEKLRATPFYKKVLTKIRLKHTKVP